MNIDLSGKIAVITGATGELGRVMARTLAGCGADVAVHLRDGYAAVPAFLPPHERRALVLIDPPYEDVGEFDSVLRALVAGWQKFPSGVFVVWYPVKSRAPVRAFLDAVKASKLRDVVAAEFLLREPSDPGRLNGCGVMVVNPPFGF